MRRILICTGVLGGGTALTFAAAALAATLLPGGTVVPSSMFMDSGRVVGGPVFAPAPAPPVVVLGGTSGAGGGVDIGMTPEPTPSD